MDEIDDAVVDSAFDELMECFDDAMMEYHASQIKKCVRAAIRAAVLAERGRIADYIEGKGGVIPGANVFAALVSGNLQPCMSGDGRDRMLPYKRKLFDEATAELAAAIRARGNGGEK